MVRASASLFAFAAFTSARGYITPSNVLPRGGSTYIVGGDRAAAQVPQAVVSITQEESPAVPSWSPVIFGLALGLFAAVVGGRAPAALAADAGSGEAVFAANCASCHAGGNNAISPDKKLNSEKLKQYGKYEPTQIVAQVTKGNGAMPAFGTKLSPEDIDDVAAYVRAQADKGW